MSGEEGSSSSSNSSSNNNSKSTGGGGGDGDGGGGNDVDRQQQTQSQQQQRQQNHQQQRQQKHQLCFVTLFVPTVMMAVLILGALHLGILGGGVGGGFGGNGGNALKIVVVPPEQQPQEQQQQQQQHETSGLDVDVDVDVVVDVEKQEQQQNQKEEEEEKHTTTTTTTTAGTAKRTARTQFFVSSTVIIPHDEKIHRGGEDAASTSSQLLVVADGVGGWARHGVNPGLFSRALTQRVVELFTTANDDDEQEQKRGASVDDTTTTSSSSSQNYHYHDFLTKIVHQANIETGNQHLGSATCTAVMLEQQQQQQRDEQQKVVGGGEQEEDGGGDDSKFTLHTLNVGDSGYSIHRRRSSRLNENKEKKNNKDKDKYELIYASEPGQKSFNFPHQLGGTKHGDKVEDVATYASHRLESNDIVVVYSDGVSDNMFPHQFHSCFEKYEHLDEENKFFLVSYSVVADCIARASYHLGKDKDFDSPFAQGARAVNKRYIGGKHDDITVVVAQVVSVGGVSMTEGVDEDSDDNGTASTTSSTTTTTSSESSSTTTVSLMGSTRDDVTKLRILQEDPYRRTTTTTTATSTPDGGSSSTSIYYLYTEHDQPIGSVDDLPTMDELLLEKKRQKLKDLASADDDDGETSSRGSTSSIAGDDEL